MTIGILLAGGKSTRFQQDKSLYFDPRYQKTWSVLQSEKLQQLTDSFYIVANTTNAPFLKKTNLFSKGKVITDVPPYVNEGPLSAFYTVAKHTKETDFLILAVDYPDVSLAVLQQLLTKPNCYAVDAKNQPHFTLAHLQFSLETITNFLESGNRRLKDFIKVCDSKKMPFPYDTLFNYNFQPKLKD